MIVVPGKFIYVGSPRTGSHYIYDVLQAHFPEAQRSPEHHAFIAQVLNAKRMNNGIPIVTVIRDPVPWVFSFYWNSLQKYPDRIIDTTFEEFIKARKPPNAPFRKAIDFPPGALCQYRHIADRFFPFEKDFNSLFKALQVDDTHDVQPKRLPTEDYLAARKQISEADKRSVRKCFKHDQQLWKMVCDT
jgi:hypothetical protein